MSISDWLLRAHGTQQHLVLYLRRSTFKKWVPELSALLTIQGLRYRCKFSSKAGKKSTLKRLCECTLLVTILGKKKILFTILLSYLHGTAGILSHAYPIYHSHLHWANIPLQCLGNLQCHSSSALFSAKWSHRDGSANLTSHYPAQNPLWTEMSHRSKKSYSLWYVCRLLCLCAAEMLGRECTPGPGQQGVHPPLQGAQVSSHALAPTIIF